MADQGGSTSAPWIEKKQLAEAVSRAVAGGVGLAGALLPGLASAQAAAIEEIVVTATKREQNLQDIPLSVQALTSDQIKVAGLNSAEDYSRFIPSMTFLSSSPGATKIVFRGVADAASTFIADSSAAIYLDEQPLTTVGQAPEVKMIDIERIEALSGPQGTLYGASSESGTLRIITRKPNTGEFEGSFEATGSTIEDGDLSYGFNGVVNIPIIKDTLAIRLVGFHSRDGGYIDNVLGNTPSQPVGGETPKPTMGQRTNADVVKNNINEVDWFGGRASVLWNINDDWAATVTGIYQKANARGFNYFDPTVGDLDVVRFVDEGRDDEWEQLNITIEGDLGWAQLVSSTSYFNREINYTLDRTTYANYFHWTFGFYYGFQGYNFGPDPISFNTLDQEDRKFSQEVRLSHDGSRWSWLFGFFYEDVEQDWNYRTFIPGYANSPALAYWNYLSYIGYLQCPGLPGDVCPSPLIDPQNAWWHSGTEDRRQQYALFTEHEFSFTDNLKVIAGGRWYHNSRSIFYFVQRPQFRPDRPASTPSGGGNGFLPKVAVQYNIDDDKMIYVLHSQGFRQGGTNRARGNPTFPRSYEADKLKNWEIGLKSTWLDGRVRVNLTGYHMLWEDYQLEVVDPSFQSPINEPFQVVVGNVGDAELNGFDFDIGWIPMEGLELAVNGTYLIDAQVAEDFSISDPRAPGVDFGLNIPKGSRLPLTANFNISGSAQYSWPVAFLNGGNAYVRFQYSYTGSSLTDVNGDFPPAGFGNGVPKLKQFSYDIGDLKIGFSNETWDAAFFVNNLWDERADIRRENGFFDWFWGGERTATNRPRNIGLRITRHF